jgi:hypothetical protein
MYCPDDNDSKFVDLLKTAAKVDFEEDKIVVHN